jgi:glycerol-3-phosphate dehydrogenase
MKLLKIHTKFTHKSFSPHPWTYSTYNSKPTVTIIGAGIIGLTTALEASLRGYQVKIIDAEPTFAKKSSFSNGGLWCP